MHGARDRDGESRKRLLIFVVAYQAESTIKEVLGRIPHALSEEYDTEVLVIDDSSTDSTFQRGREFVRDKSLPFPSTILFNPVNQGYGGNQKIGYHYARKHGFDFVALLHGDGQYAPECLPDLLLPLRDGVADACFGSRMIEKGRALRGGMPLYKFIGNKILSWFENKMLRTHFTEFHSGYRIYSVAALSKVPFDLNTNEFHFDTEIIVQFLNAGLRIVERPIPTYYGDEICRVNGMKYAWNVVRAVTKARLQQLGVFYDRRFDCAPGTPNAQYQPKFDYRSTHSLVLDAVSPGARILDLGCAGGYMAAALKARKNCKVVGVDLYPLEPGVAIDAFYQHDLDKGLPSIEMGVFDVVLLLDVIEHLSRPEEFVQQLRERLKYSPNVRIIVTTGNVAFAVTRAMLSLGQFNYGKRGILDMTHTRLFTFATLRRLFEQSGFRILQSLGVPAPFPLAIKGRLGRFLLHLNGGLIRIWKSLFAYQIMIVVQPLPGLEYLLESAEARSAQREARQG